MKWQYRATNAKMSYLICKIIIIYTEHLLSATYRHWTSGWGDKGA